MSQLPAKCFPRITFGQQIILMINYLASNYQIIYLHGNAKKNLVFSFSLISCLQFGFLLMSKINVDMTQRRFFEMHKKLNKSMRTSTELIFVRSKI